MNCNHKYEIAPRPDYLGKHYECTECGHEIDCEAYEYISKFKEHNDKLKAFANAILDSDLEFYDMWIFYKANDFGLVNDGHEKTEVLL